MSTDFFIYSLKKYLYMKSGKTFWNIHSLPQIKGFYGLLCDFVNLKKPDS